MKYLSRFLAIVILIIIASGNLKAQSSFIYSRGASSEGYRAIPTADGGFLIGGHGDDTLGNTVFWVVKVSKHGVIKWDSLYTRFDKSFLWSIQPTKEGGALLAGYTGVQFSGNESAWIVKIDSVGRIVKQYDVDYARSDHAHWCAERPQGGYFWGGHTESEGDPTGEMILQRLDTGMNKLWEHTYELDSNAYEHAHCGSLTSDGGCMLAGHTEVGGNENTWAVRVDSNGRVMWKKLLAYSSSTGDSPYGAITTHEGGFAIFGGEQTPATSAVRLLVIDSVGNKIVDKLYGDGSSWGWNGIECSDGGFAVVGYYSANATDPAQAYLIRTDSKGNVRWQKKYQAGINTNAYDVIQRGSDFILVGSVDSGANSNLWCLIVDSNGVPTTFDTSAGPQPLLFTLDTTGPLTWSWVKMDSLSGAITNPNSDSVFFTFSVTFDAKNRSGQFLSMEKLGDSTRLFGSGKNLSIAPHSVLPVSILIDPYEPSQNDTASVCYSVSRVGDSTSASQEICITLYPEATGAVTKEQGNQPRVQIFPNPVSVADLDKESICSSNIIQQVEIFDLLGNCRSSRFLTPAVNTVSFSLLCRNGLSQGVYVVHVQTITSNEWIKLVVQ